MRSLLVVGAVLFSVVLGVSVFALLVWPTPWETHVMRSDGVDKLYRVHRFGGTMDVMTKTGWRRVGRPVTASAPDQSLPALSCAEFESMKRQNPHFVRNADLFYRLPACP